MFLTFFVTKEAVTPKPDKSPKEYSVFDFPRFFADKEAITPEPDKSQGQMRGFGNVAATLFIVRSIT